MLLKCFAVVSPPSDTALLYPRSKVPEQAGRSGRRATLGFLRVGIPLFKVGGWSGGWVGVVDGWRGGGVGWMRSGRVATSHDGGYTLNLNP